MGVDAMRIGVRAARLPLVALVGAWALVAMTPGCQTYDKASSAATFAPGLLGDVNSAPHDGNYYLFRGDEKAPVAQVYLTTGQAIGFRVDATDSIGRPVGPPGSTSAVAGSFAVPIDINNRYEWKYIPK
jgi:hypothetical protein